MILSRWPLPAGYRGRGALSGAVGERGRAEQPLLDLAEPELNRAERDGAVAELGQSQARGQHGAGGQMARHRFQQHGTTTGDATPDDDEIWVEDLQHGGDSAGEPG